MSDITPTIASVSQGLALTLSSAASISATMSGSSIAATIQSSALSNSVASAATLSKTLEGITVVQPPGWLAVEW